MHTFSLDEYVLPAPRQQIVTFLMQYFNVSSEQEAVRRARRVWDYGTPDHEDLDPEQPSYCLVAVFLNALGINYSASGFRPTNEQIAHIKQVLTT